MCGDACIEKHLESTEALRIFDDYRVTGLMRLASFSHYYYVVTASGKIWQRKEDYSDGIGPNIQDANKPDAIPPQFVGTVFLDSAEAALDSVGAKWSFWGQPDLISVQDDRAQFGLSYIINFTPISEFVPLPRQVEESAFLSSDIGLLNLFGVRSSWTEFAMILYNSYEDRDAQTLTQVVYNPTANELISSIDQVELARTVYEPLAGVKVCAMATDGRYIFLAENRVYEDATGTAKMGGGRIVQILIESGEIVDTWPSAVGPSCALEIGLAPGSLLSVQYTTDKVPFLATYLYAQ